MSNFIRPSRDKIKDEVERARERRRYAQKRDYVRLRSDPGRSRRRRVFLAGKRCEACEGCERPAYAHDPIDRETIVCRAAYMRSWRKLKRTRSPGKESSPSLTLSTSSKDRHK